MSVVAMKNNKMHLVDRSDFLLSDDKTLCKSLQ